jgi:predicted DsbA family dithiol-disulfide isomerase
MTMVTVWSDIRCPWCWMGHRRLAAAFVAEVEADHRAAVEHGVSSIPALVHEGRHLGGARNVDELVEFLSGAETVR